MRYFFLIIGVVVLSVLQSALAVNFSISQTFANLTLVFSLVVSIYATTNEALFTAFLAGGFADYVSGLPDGVFIITFLFLFLILKFVAGAFLEKKENMLTLAAVVLGVTLIYYIFVFLSSEVFARFLDGMDFSPGNLFKKNLWIEAVLNLIVLYPIYLYYILLMNLSAKYEK